MAPQTAHPLWFMEEPALPPVCGELDLLQQEHARMAFGQGLLGPAQLLALAQQSLTPLMELQAVHRAQPPMVLHARARALME